MTWRLREHAAPKDDRVQFPEAMSDGSQLYVTPIATSGFVHTQPHIPLIKNKSYKI